MTVIRYTPMRSFVLRLNDTGGDLAPFVPKVDDEPTSDAAVGGGSGGSV